MNDDPAALVGTVLAGRYEVTGVLGAGGMGVVLAARQIAMDRKVAVKLLHPGLSANRHAVARFIREMKVTSRLEHPATVRVYDFGEAEVQGAARLFLVMELVQGRTLAALLADGMPPHRRTLAIGEQIARALEAAHGEGIVHRDLKPDNVMLVDRYGQSDQVKVLDFGIARFFDGSEADPSVGRLTAEGAVVGTPAYMSPEQATGAPIGPASDLYSLGIMLFEMATGTVPFTAPTTVSLMVKHVQDSPPAPSSIVPLPTRLEALILACLEKDPARRPASARVVADELAAIARGLAGEAPAPPAGVTTERTVGGTAASEAITARRIGDEPERSWRRLAPWLVGAALLVGLFVAMIAVNGGSNGSEGAGGDIAAVPDAEPARVLAMDAAGATAADTARPEVQAALGPTDEPAPGAGCRSEVVEAARKALRDKDEGALEKARAGVAACGDWAVAQVVLGQAEQARAAWPAARAAYLEAITVAPGWGVPRFDLALVELAAGRPDEARAALDALLALDPTWPDARLLRAQAGLASKDFAGARRDAEAATAQTPERAEAWFLLGESHRALGGGVPDAQGRAAYCKAKALGMAAAARGCDGDR